MHVRAQQVRDVRMPQPCTGMMCEVPACFATRATQLVKLSGLIGSPLTRIVKSLPQRVWQPERSKQAAANSRP